MDQFILNDQYYANDRMWQEANEWAATVLTLLFGQNIPTAIGLWYVVVLV